MHQAKQELNGENTVCDRVISKCIKMPRHKGAKLRYGCIIPVPSASRSLHVRSPCRLHPVCCYRWMLYAINSPAHRFACSCTWLLNSAFISGV